MPKYKFSEIAYNINQKKMPEPGDEEMYIGLEHLDSGSLKVKRWGSDVPITGEKLVMKKGDILFGRRNTYLRRAAIAPHDGIFSAHGMIFRPNTAVMDEDYFPFFISSDYFMNAAIRISVGSLSPTVNWKTLKELEFDIPDLESQRKSAELLTAANRLKEAYEILLEETDQLVKSQFIEMFGNPITNNMQWPTQPLRKVAPEHTPQIPSMDKYWWLNLDMIESYSGIVIEKVYAERSEIGSSTSTFDDTMVLYSKLRPYLNKVVVPEDFGYATTELVGLKPDSSVLNKYFLFNLLRGDDFVSYANGISGGAQMPRMPVKALREFECILPPMELQEQFVALSEQSDKSKFEIKQFIKNITEVINSLLQQDFNI